jgi:hypothetical protein
MNKSIARKAGITNSKNLYKVKRTAVRKIKNIKKALLTSKNQKTFLDRLKFWESR